MNIHECQGKEILRKHNVPVSHGTPTSSVDEAIKAAETLGGPAWVVRAQIHAGGHDKGGGVKVAKSIEQVKEHASSTLGMTLMTHQTGPEGKLVERLLTEEGTDVERELYMSLVVDRVSQQMALIASSEGGTGIEEVVESHSEKAHTLLIDPQVGLQDAQVDDTARKIGVLDASIAQARQALQGLYKVFRETDVPQAEINPLILTGSDEVIALDAKLNFDSNTLLRHLGIVAYRDLDEEDPAEIEVSKFDLAYISSDGNIGYLMDGAGLIMATMDTIKLLGGEPANFLDVGGGATAEKVTEAFKLMLKNPDMKVILVNIFGGTVRCDVIAEGVIAAAKTVSLSVPLVVHMKGTNEDLGKRMLADSGLSVTAADTMARATEKVVVAAADK